MRLFKFLCLLLLVLAPMPAICATLPVALPIPIKVVVVCMFELGADTGDAPGEYQFWVERERLDRTSHSRPGTTICA